MCMHDQEQSLVGGDRARLGGKTAEEVGQTLPAVIAYRRSGGWDDGSRQSSGDNLDTASPSGGSRAGASSSTRLRRLKGNSRGRR